MGYLSYFTIIQITETARYVSKNVLPSNAHENNKLITKIFDKLHYTLQ